ncbi:MAG: hypothetical protein ACKN91_00050 [Candidatus Fonsibacter sp.]
MVIQCKTVIIHQHIQAVYPKQAKVRCDPKLKNKGGEAVRAALSVYNSIYKL